MPRGDLDDFELERTPYTPRDEPELTPAPRPEPKPERELRRQPETRAERRPERTPERTIPASGPVELDDPTAEEEIPRSPAVAEGGSRLFPLTLVAVALVAFGVLALLFVVFRNPAKRQAADAPVTGAAARPQPASPAPSVPAGPLPALEESDDYVRSLAAGLSGHAELARWLAQPALVRTLAAVVTNVAEGETPRPHLGFLAPGQRFRVRGLPGRRTVADPASFSGYDRFADAVASVDTPAAVAAYRTLEPLFDAAYRELGHPEGGFRSGLDTALAALLAAPVPPPDAELVPHAIGFRYADPRLEGLTAAQKQFLRIGPRNVRLVQAKLRELQAALGTAEQPPPADRGR